MKLTYFQLEAHLAKKPAAIYLVSGDELFLKQEALQLLRKAARQAGVTERIKVTPEAGYDWDQLYTLLYSTSLMQEKRLIELDFQDILPNKTASKILQEYAAKPLDDNILILDLSKVDAKIAKSAWYTALEKIGIAIAIWPLPREQIPQWIINRAKKYKMQINLNAATLLGDFVEGNLVAAAQYIEKLYLLKLDKPVDKELVASILSDESRFTVFDLIENLIAGDIKRAFHVLESLRQDSAEPVLILWAITRELRLMSDMAQQKQQGTGYDTLFQKYKIFSRRQIAVRRFLQTFSPKDCWHYLSQALELDRMAKGAAPGNVWDALQVFCLKFAA